MPPKPHDEETRPYEKKQEAFFNAQMLKILGICYAVGTPFFVWVTVSIFTMQAELAVQKEKMGTILEIRQDIQAIKNDINQLKIDVSVLKSKGQP
jgi:hypothetical protein